MMEFKTNLRTQSDQPWGDHMGLQALVTLPNSPSEVLKCLKYGKNHHYNQQKIVFGEQPATEVDWQEAVGALECWY